MEENDGISDDPDGIYYIRRCADSRDVLVGNGQRVQKGKKEEVIK